MIHILFYIPTQNNNDKKLKQKVFDILPTTYFYNDEINENYFNT